MPYCGNYHIAQQEVKSMCSPHTYQATMYMYNYMYNVGVRMCNSTSSSLHSSTYWMQCVSVTISDILVHRGTTFLFMSNNPAIDDYNLQLSIKTLLV